MLLAQAGKNVRAQMRALYPYLRTDVEDDALREALGTPLSAAGSLDGLDEVTFDSPPALALAKGWGMTWSDFAQSSRGPSGSFGFTVEDVKAIHHLGEL